MICFKIHNAEDIKENNKRSYIMGVIITCLEYDENNVAEAKFQAVEADTGAEVSTRVWYEKSKDKFHIVLGENSSNRKYIAVNAFIEGQNDDGEFHVEDKTTGPRVLGTAQPDRKLVPFMTAADKASYDAIIERALANRASTKEQPQTEEERLEAQIAKIKARLAAKKAGK